MSSSEPSDAFRSRLRAVSELEAQTGRTASFVRDTQTAIEAWAQTLHTHLDTTDFGTAAVVQLLYTRWKLFQQTTPSHEEAAHTERACDPLKSQEETEFFLATAAAHVADHLVSLAGHPQPWEATASAATVLPACASLAANTDNQESSTMDAVSATWRTAALVGSFSDASGWEDMHDAVHCAAVWLPRALYQCWAGALALMAQLVAHTIGELDTSATRELTCTIRHDLLLCMLREAQRHAPHALSDARQGTPSDTPVALADLRLAFLHLHLELWLLSQCACAEDAELRHVALREFSATASELVDVSAEVGTAACTRCLVGSPLSSEESQSWLRALLAEITVPLSIPPSLLQAPQAEPATQPVLWCHLAPAWLGQVLSPIAHQLLQASSPLAQLWQHQECDAENRSGGDDDTNASLVRVRLLALLHTLESELGRDVTDQIAAYRTLRDLATAVYDS